MLATTFGFMCADIVLGKINKFYIFFLEFKARLTLSGRLRCSLGNHHSLNRFGAKRLEPGSADRRFYGRRRWCVFAAPVEFTGAVRNELNVKAEVKL